MCPIMFYKLFNANSTIFLFFRSSHLEMFCKKSVLRNFAKFTGKHLCQDLFFDKVAGLRLWHRCFSVNFVKFLRTHFLIEHLRWLLLLFLSAYMLLPVCFTLLYLPPPLLYSEVLFLYLILYLGAYFYQIYIYIYIYIYIGNHKKIWEIVVLTINRQVYN